MSAFTIQDLAYFPGRMNMGAGFLDTISRPDVMDQALLYIAPWHWKEKKKEERKSFKQAEKARQADWFRRTAERQAQERAQREERHALSKARRNVREGQRRINDASSYVNEAAGEVSRITAQYNLSHRFRNEAAGLSDAAMTLALEAPSPLPNMNSAQLDDLALELERVLGIMQQLAVRAENLVRTARVYRR